MLPSPAGLGFSRKRYDITCAFIGLADAQLSAAGIGALQDEAYTQKNIQTIIENRTYTVEGLQKIGFEVLPSQTNFIFAKHPGIGGEKLYAALKEKGILVRHFNKERIKAFNRITIGTKEQMQILIHTVTEILTVEGIQWEKQV